SPPALGAVSVTAAGETKTVEPGMETSVEPGETPAEPYTPPVEPTAPPPPPPPPPTISEAYDATASPSTD
ncbi:MAG: hypothetical protein V3W19_06080, partial [Desulfatiglandales bacterium]